MPNPLEQIVLDFMDCWRRNDLEDAVSRISDGAVFQPDPKAAEVVGRPAIRILWAEYMSRILSYDLEVRHLHGSGGVVFLERIERLTSARGGMILPIVGVYELNADGKIKVWRDYWDPAMA